MCMYHAPAASNTAVDTHNTEALPTNVLPTHYSLHLTPDLEKFTFEGVIDISLKIHQSTSKITLHTNELELHETSLVLHHNKADQRLGAPTSTTHDAKLEQTTFTWPMELPAGATATLTIKYTGIHNDKMAGFYRSGYELNGQKKWMVVTQFEATDARRAFPCWDEPLHKATYDVTLKVRNHLTALSNMNVASETTQGEHKVVKFARTPLMSTYLLAFAVGELEYIEAKTSPNCKALPNPVTVRVYTSHGLSSQGKFALGVAVKVLEYFSEMYGEAYPLPKMDMIAVPDFSAGAMENWGLVTYRTIYLLFDEKTSTAKTKQGVAYVVSHELAHQWFGNLVSPVEWSYLFLNEAFATYVGWLAVDHLFPEWKIWTGFVGDEMSRALTLDALRSSHPIYVPVKSPSEVMQIFDAISYSKGASVLRMLVEYLGQDAFRQGLRAYIQKHKYGNTNSKDLWDALTGAAGFSVHEFMTNWETKIGYPVLQVENNGKGEIKVTQKRFLATGDAKPEEDETIWQCPLALYAGDDATALAFHGQGKILLTKTATFALPPPAANAKVQAYKLNRKQTNLYRVAYPASDLIQLGQAMKQDPTFLDTADRVGLVSDVFALAAAGYSSTVAALDILKFFDTEKEYLVLNTVAHHLGELKTVWAFEDAYPKLEVLARNLFAPTARRMGWEFPEGESYLDTQLRQLALSVAGASGDKDVVAEAKARFARFMKGDEAAIHPNVRGAVYSIVLKHSGTRAEFDQVRGIWERGDLAVDQRLAALSALGAVQDTKLLQEVLDYAMDESKVRPQDFMYPLRGVAHNRRGRALAWRHVQTHWTELERRFKGSMSLLAHCISIASDWADESFAAKEVEAFFADKDTSTVDRAIAQTLEKIRGHAKWLQRDRAGVADWLAKNVQG